MSIRKTWYFSVFEVQQKALSRQLQKAKLEAIVMTKGLNFSNNEQNQYLEKKSVCAAIIFILLSWKFTWWINYVCMLLSHLFCQLVQNEGWDSACVNCSKRWWLPTPLPVLHSRPWAFIFFFWMPPIQQHLFQLINVKGKVTPEEIRKGISRMRQSEMICSPLPHRHTSGRERFEFNLANIRQAYI